MGELSLHLLIVICGFNSNLWPPGSNEINLKSNRLCLRTLGGFYYHTSLTKDQSQEHDKLENRSLHSHFLFLSRCLSLTRSLLIMISHFPVSLLQMHTHANTRTHTHSLSQSLSLSNSLSLVSAYFMQISGELKNDGGRTCFKNNSFSRNLFLPVSICLSPSFLYYWLATCQS